MGHARSLTLPELGGLSDVPILLMVLMNESTDAAIYKGLLALPPGKLLFLGTNALLTDSFRGGG